MYLDVDCSQPSEYVRVGLEVMIPTYQSILDASVGSEPQFIDRLLIDNLESTRVSSKMAILAET